MVYAYLYSSAYDAVLNASPFLFKLGLFILFATCLYSGWRMYKWLHNARLVENTATSSIRAAVQGYVELVGHAKVMEGSRIISASGAECVWYRYKAIQIDNRHWDWGPVLILARSILNFSNSNFSPDSYTVSDDLFLLEDETGQCVIDPDYADVIATRKKTWYDHDTDSIFGGSTVKYTEYRIDEGDALYASGLFETHGHITENNEKEALISLLEKWKRDPDQLAKFDENNDGEISMDEWETVRQAAMREIKRGQIQSEAQQLLNVLRSSRKKDEPFILSAKSETSLIKRYYLRAVVALIVFISSGSLLIWAFNLRQGIS